MMLLLFFSLFLASFACAKCYEPSETHPLPDYDPNDVLLKTAFARISQAIEATIAAPEFDATSFSVEVTSSKDSLWSHHHTARQRNASRPDIPQVNGDALYRIASITKSFTVLGILYQHAAGNLSVDDSIDTYIEELKGDQNGTIPWKDITLRSLASQLSGIPREFAQGDAINAQVDLWKYGFPPLSREGLPNCDEYAHYDPPCGPSDLIREVKSMVPLFAPNQKSSYSNVAFELLGLVIANVTNQTYESYIEDAIFKPLGMSKSTLSTPPDSAGVIPLQPHYWGVDEGVQNPTGGIYSSSTDLSKYLRYILNKYNGITTALNWAHPVSPTQGLNSFYGTPWEMFRTDRILLNSRQAVTFVTKGGGLPGYFTIIITIPQYDLGVTILVAGNSDALENLQEIVTVELVRAAEGVAIRQLQERYAGTFVPSKAGLNSSLSLVADHRGLVIEEFISNGTDILNSELFWLSPGLHDGPAYAQVVPTLLYRNESEQEGERWRIIVTDERTDEPGPIWDDWCITNMDPVLYAGLPTNEIVFWEGDDAAFDTAELTGFRVKLKRSSEGGVDLKDSQEFLEL